jgi:hypothetical protein
MRFIKLKSTFIAISGEDEGIVNNRNAGGVRGFRDFHLGPPRFLP